jgi:VanZ family protein
MIIKSILRWIPAMIIMAIIFGFSSIPSTEMPIFGGWDPVFKKGAHMLGYGLLAMAYWYALHFTKRYWWLIFILVILYAVSDEYHQSFVPGRHPSWVDVFFYDGGGAALMMFVFSITQKKIR